MTPRYFEDFTDGQEFVTPTHTVTVADVDTFAGLTGDHYPLHVDEEFARKSIYGGRIAHGLLGLALAVGLKTHLALYGDNALAFLGMEWAFTGPIRPGDTVRARVRIAGTRPTRRPDRGVVTEEITVENQRGEVVQRGHHHTLVRRRPAPGQAE